jgi:hypothetical protein
MSRPGPRLAKVIGATVKVLGQVTPVAGPWGYRLVYRGPR